MDQTDKLRRDFNRMDGLLRAIDEETFDPQNSTTRSVSPQGIKLFNSIGRRFNNLFPNEQVMIFPEDTTPNLVTHPKVQELLYQVGCALDTLRGGSDEARIEGARGSQCDAVNQEPCMKVFISHSSKDKACAEAFVALLRAALSIGAKDIRCTTVDGYKLPAGSSSNEVLRSEVFGCEAFIALLSPSSMASVYVMFELGARWGSGRCLVPVAISGFGTDDLKDPLSAIHIANGTSDADMYQLLEKVAETLAISPESPAVYQKQLRDFLSAASALIQTEEKSVREPLSIGTSGKPQSKLRSDILAAVNELESKHGKAESMRLVEYLSRRYDFGTVLGELLVLRDNGIVRWDGDQDAPAAYVGIELVRI